MKRLVKILLLMVSVVLFAQLAEAKVYKWKDSQGRWQYSDVPPLDSESETLKTQTFKKRAKPVVSKTKTSAKADNATLTVDAENAAVMQQNCDAAKANLVSYSVGGRVRRTNKYGEMVYLNEQEIAKATAKAQKQVEQYCH